MPCNCHEKNRQDFPEIHPDPTRPFSRANPTTQPRDPCLYCAEKHIATAAALAREQGYAGVNRGYVIGEIVAACWHLNGAGQLADILSKHLRALRHRIQSRTEDETATDFSPFLLAIDLLINQQEQPSRKESAL